MTLADKIKAIATKSCACGLPSCGVRDRALALIAETLHLIGDDIEAHEAKEVITLGWLYQEIADYRLHALAEELDPE